MEEIEFNKDKFMEEQWARLAAMYGVSVEEVKSKEFDERLKQEFEEQRKKDAAIDRRESSEVWRIIQVWAVCAGIVSALGWFIISPNKWWFPIPGFVIAMGFMSIQEVSFSHIKRQDYPNDSQKYWDRVKSALVNCQIMSIGIVIIGVLYLAFLFAGK